MDGAMQIRHVAMSWGMSMRRRRSARSQLPRVKQQATHLMDGTAGRTPLPSRALGKLARMRSGNRAQSLHPGMRAIMAMHFLPRCYGGASLSCVE